MENHEIKPIIEALLFVAGDPISIDRLAEVVKGVDNDRILEQLVSLQREYLQSDRGVPR